MTKDSEARSEITLEDIATKLFMRYPIFQRDGERKVWEIFRDEDQNKISKILQPRHDAKIILAKYYELKYGIKIVNLKTSKDLERFQSFVNFKKDTAEAFKIGAIQLFRRIFCNSKFFGTHVHLGTLTFQKILNHKNFLEKLDLRQCHNRFLSTVR